MDNLDKLKITLHEQETAIIEAEKTPLLDKNRCDKCNCHHRTEDCELIDQRRKLSNFEAAQRLIKRFPDDDKLRKALTEGGWLNG